MATKQNGKTIDPSVSAKLAKFQMERRSHNYSDARAQAFHAFGIGYMSNQKSIPLSVRLNDGIRAFNHHVTSLEMAEPKRVALRLFCNHLAQDLGMNYSDDLNEYRKVPGVYTLESLIGPKVANRLRAFKLALGAQPQTA